ncbi:MAG: hypothetical protein WAX44_04240 [Minisyncoccia bacterium]
MILLTNMIDHAGIPEALDQAGVSSDVVCLSNVPSVIEEQVQFGTSQLLITGMIHSDVQSTVAFAKKMRGKNQLISVYIYTEYNSFDLPKSVFDARIQKRPLELALATKSFLVQDMK